MKIFVNGVTYEISYHYDTEDIKLKDMDGYCDCTSKQIVIRKLTKEQTCEIDNCRDMDAYFNKVLRHELVHAMLYESGLHVLSENAWAVNEEIIDWMAIQIPKLALLYNQLEI